MTSLVDANTYRFLQNICPFSAARHPPSATRSTAWWMELMDMAACPAPTRLDWHIKEREGGREGGRQRDGDKNLDSFSTLPCQQSVWRTETWRELNINPNEQNHCKTIKGILPHAWRLNKHIIKKIMLEISEINLSFIINLMLISSCQDQIIFAPFQNLHSWLLLTLKWGEWMSCWVFTNLIKLTFWRNTVSLLAFVPSISQSFFL